MGFMKHQRVNEQVQGGGAYSFDVCFQRRGLGCCYRRRDHGYLKLGEHRESLVWMCKKEQTTGVASPNANGLTIAGVGAGSGAAVRGVHTGQSVVKPFSGLRSSMIISSFLIWLWLSVFLGHFSRCASTSTKSLLLVNF